MHSTRFFFISLFLALALPAFFLTQHARAAVSYVCDNGLGAAATTVVGRTCYALFGETKNWSDAQASCVSKGGVLARLRSSEINTAIASISGLNDPWIGAGDDTSIVSGASEGNFFWIGDQVAFWMGGQGGAAVNGTYTNWSVVEPNDNGGHEDCVQMYHVSGFWNDLTCTDLSTYVCELPTVEWTELTHGGLRAVSLQRRIDQAVQTMNKKASPAAHPAASTNVATVSSAKPVVVTAPKAMITTATSAVSSAKSFASASVAPAGSDIRIVATPTLNLRTDSRINSYIIKVLTKGQTMTLLGISHNDWAHIRLPNGTEGYVWRKHLTK